ncbi:MAG: hypothetical protein ACREGH_02800, partial [Minisyncoccia bacterium]
KLSIDFFGEEQLRDLFGALQKALQERVAMATATAPESEANPLASDLENEPEHLAEMLDDRTEEEKRLADENEFDPSSFSV